MCRGRLDPAVGLLGFVCGRGCANRERGGVETTIVMCLDQHRAPITAERLDTDTGEVAGSRITPAHRAGVRRFCEQFRGRELEVSPAGIDAGSALPHPDHC